ncbi:hypothetical protein BpHYR1_023881 [Brachionus plicatilis]|uniref:Uncharacterized protein n=1 Tax=Brachionus plicatilis TaxID=10195 RepID=A0A3M7PPE1_BRAPC|nr:hypothetical protein BpHYR1_023881 [Brachionus plicatilis]
MCHMYLCLFNFHFSNNTVSPSSENVLDYQDTSVDVDSDSESETSHRKRKRSKGQVYNVHSNYQLFDEVLKF